MNGAANLHSGGEDGQGMPRMGGEQRGWVRSSEDGCNRRPDRVGRARWRPPPNRQQDGLARERQGDRKHLHLAKSSLLSSLLRRRHADRTTNSRQRRGWAGSSENLWGSTTTGSEDGERSGQRRAVNDLRRSRGVSGRGWGKTTT